MLTVPKPFRAFPASKSTTSLLNLRPIVSQHSDECGTAVYSDAYSSFEYEDISFLEDSPVTISKLADSTPDLTLNVTKKAHKTTDILARESDVIISTQITPLTEYKGFALYLLATLFHVIWLLWTLLPKKWLNCAGIYYYPSRWWSVSISTFVLMSMLYIYVALQLWNMEHLAVDTCDLRNLIDRDAAVEKDWEKFAWCATSGVFDLRITDVNNLLYDDDTATKE